MDVEKEIFRLPSFNQLGVSDVDRMEEMLQYQSEVVRELQHQQQLLAYSISLLQCQMQNNFIVLSEKVDALHKGSSSEPIVSIPTSYDDVISSPLYNPYSLSGLRIHTVFVEWFKHDFETLYKKVDHSKLTKTVNSNIRRIQSCIEFMMAFLSTPVPAKPSSSEDFKQWVEEILPLLAQEASSGICSCVSTHQDTETNLLVSQLLKYRKEFRE